MGSRESEFDESHVRIGNRHVVVPVALYERMCRVYYSSKGIDDPTPELVEPEAIEPEKVRAAPAGSVQAPDGSSVIAVSNLGSRLVPRGAARKKFAALHPNRKVDDGVE